ncbi:DUF5667 domain-containing protein [Patescibacteria group bacterium]|nr:DUF5667 domain-containing protein [Patescibacteria group bacterium]
MKKTALAVFAATLTVLLGSSGALHATAAPVVLVLARNASQGIVVPAPGMMQEGTMSSTIEYTLPYPGILPDHPLYFLKQIRDKILDWLIVDPGKKADFLILQADKRLAMGIALTDEGKTVLAEQTISKGEKYMDRAVGELETLKDSGKFFPPGLLDHLRLSMAKHTEVLGGMITQASGTVRSGLEGSVRLVGQLGARVKAL